MKSEKAEFEILEFRNVRNTKVSKFSFFEINFTKLQNFAIFAKIPKFRNKKNEICLLFVLFPIVIYFR